MITIQVLSSYAIIEIKFVNMLGHFLSPLIHPFTTNNNLENVYAKIQKISKNGSEIID